MFVYEGVDCFEGVGCDEGVNALVFYEDLYYLKMTAAEPELFTEGTE